MAAAGGATNNVVKSKKRKGSKEKEKRPQQHRETSKKLTKGGAVASSHLRMTVASAAEISTVSHVHTHTLVCVGASLMLNHPQLPTLAKFLGLTLWLAPINYKKSMWILFPLCVCVCDVHMYASTRNVNVLETAWDARTDSATHTLAHPYTQHEQAQYNHLRTHLSSYKNAEAWIIQRYCNAASASASALLALLVSQIEKQSHISNNNSA